MSAPRIYLAGPDVFLPNARALAQTKQTLCVSYGFIGVSPIDSELGVDGLSKHDAAPLIALANEQAIRTCTLLIANLTPFRGPSADVGTVYEMGFARALGLPVFGYTNVAGSLLERTRKDLDDVMPRASGEFEDADGMVIEDFDCFDNLMLVGALADGPQIVVTPTPHAQRFSALIGFEVCLQLAAQHCGIRGGPVRVGAR